MEDKSKQRESKLSVLENYLKELQTKYERIVQSEVEKTAAL
jgi:hypothetical protein